MVVPAKKSRQQANRRTSDVQDAPAAAEARKREGRRRSIDEVDMREQAMRETARAVKIAFVERAIKSCKEKDRIVDAVRGHVALGQFEQVRHYLVGMIQRGRENFVSRKRQTLIDAINIIKPESPATARAVYVAFRKYAVKKKKVN